MSRVLGVVSLDMRGSARERFNVPAWAARSRVRRAVGGMRHGDVLKLRVNRWSLPSDVLGLIPEGVRVQLSVDDGMTLREWTAILGGDNIE